MSQKAYSLSNGVLVGDMAEKEEIIQHSHFIRGDVSFVLLFTLLHHMELQ
jgi:hypothetical protein